MDDCCGVPDAGRYDAVFGATFARDVARRYRRRGLTGTERRIVDFVTSTGIVDASVLEVGGGVGEIQLELLSRGASRSVNLELSSAYEKEAAELIARAGVSGRVTRILGVDLAREPEAVERADVVILHRVVCCYPDYEALLAAAAGRALRSVVFSYPPRSWLTRWGVAFENLMFRLSRRSYRGFVHPPGAMAEVVRRSGLEPTFRSRGFAWSVIGATRPQPVGG
jgi:magnesium-protoporphyrin O-methyltransferase